MVSWSIMIVEFHYLTDIDHHGRVDLSLDLGYVNVT